MHCPYCGSKNTDVVETRDGDDQNTIRRRRSCVVCQKRFTTYERIEYVHLSVLKRDGRKENFQLDKVRNGIIKACEKTNISIADINRIAVDIERELRSCEALEITSARIGEIIAGKLKSLDKVAYIRFASVFKRFEEAKDFTREVKKL